MRSLKEFEAEKRYESPGDVKYQVDKIRYRHEPNLYSQIKVRSKKQQEIINELCSFTKKILEELSREWKRKNELLDELIEARKDILIFRDRL